ncbi:MAG TPA: TlpA disulfide reductase family protein [Candidatus Rubrimentiphilum sp.]|nr:TlpA disulfide reductase family protein [Candidatus Rubrimentiphilum sp.]
MPQAQQPAPNWTEPTSTGGTLSLSSLRGKAVYMNFFATWCGPCKDEAPFINTMQKRYGARGLQVVGIDEFENAKQAEIFRKRYGLVYPAVLDSGTLQSQYLVNGLPVHVFIGRNGIIHKIAVGQLSKAQIASNVAAILKQ